MGKKAALATTLSRVTRPLGFRVEPEVSWDGAFKNWIADARTRKVDPNDLGDQAWGTDRLRDIGLPEHYAPRLRSDAVIVELGPGSGRLSRHLVGKCDRLILVDRSECVIRWLQRYLAGKGEFDAHVIDGPRFPLAAATADAAFAHGVVEHLPTEDLYWYLHEMRRVLKSGGVAAFNFNNLASSEGALWMSDDYKPLTRTSFRLHMPETIERLASLAGFRRVAIFPTDNRTAFAELTV